MGREKSTWCCTFLMTTFHFSHQAIICKYLRHFNPYYSTTDHLCVKITLLLWPDLATDVNNSLLSSSLDALASLTTGPDCYELGKLMTPEISKSGGVFVPKILAPPSCIYFRYSMEQVLFCNFVWERSQRAVIRW